MHHHSNPNMTDHHDHLFPRRPQPRIMATDEVERRWVQRQEEEILLLVDEEDGPVVVGMSGQAMLVPDLEEKTSIRGGTKITLALAREGLEEVEAEDTGMVELVGVVMVHTKTEEMGEILVDLVAVNRQVGLRPHRERLRKDELLYLPRRDWTSLAGLSGREALKMASRKIVKRIVSGGGDVRMNRVRTRRSKSRESRMLKNRTGIPNLITCQHLQHTSLPTSLL